MPTVLLLRDKTTTPSPDENGTDPLAPTDPYERAFAAHGHRTVFLPVLEHVLTHTDALASTLRAGPDERYWGIVVTSQRAVEALQVAWAACCAVDPAFSTSPPARAWLALPFFAVGPSTARASAALGFTPLASSSGKAAALADEILAHLARSSGPFPPLESLLFLAGDKRRDVLPAKLADAGVRLDEITTYRTQPVARFEEALRRCVEVHGKFDWVVFFSPSGVDVAMADLEKLEFWGMVRVAAIGPTTGDHIAVREKGSGEAHVVAERPEAESVASGITKFDQGQGKE
ncbi:tetrapyrrole biosynthesis, uroporphyrinogen III synthase [Endogone sp. FLAS-F59071]|nr:tetrapyrrole biosynthesis, uroporphyrinogen III synthase [Endogone sp. FLAS-F59071]|eukprot:RUS21923.1 tetrapyrrole biosynthesis, uroporphyrinogen III synthase [Endogone sp. FLAS-F59071]